MTIDFTPEGMKRLGAAAAASLALIEHLGRRDESTPREHPAVVKFNNALHELVVLFEAIPAERKLDGRRFSRVDGKAHIRVLHVLPSGAVVFQHTDKSGQACCEPKQCARAEWEVMLEAFEEVQP
jgi:hypothetical protein